MKRGIKTVLFTTAFVALGSVSLVNASSITNESSIVAINTGEENQNNVNIYINGSEVQKQVVPGGTVNLTTDEVQELITKNGWDKDIEQWTGKLYTDRECTQEYTANTPITADMSLYTNFKNRYGIWIVLNIATPDTNGFTYEQEQEIDIPTYLEVIEGETINPELLKIGLEAKAESMGTGVVPVTLVGYYTNAEIDENTGRYVYLDEYKWDFDTPINNETTGVEGGGGPASGSNYGTGLTLYAKWESNSDGSESIYPVSDEKINDTYTVTFEYETNSGDSTTFTQEVKVGGTIAEPETPVKEGYDFAGWLTGDGEKYDFNTIVESDVVLYAEWYTPEEVIDNDLPGAVSKSLTQKIVDAIKTIMIIAAISLIPILGILALLIGFIKKIKKVSILNDKNTDEYKEPNYKEIYTTSVKTEGNVIAELFRQEDRVWKLSIPENIINERTTDDFKIVLNKQFCNKYNGEQLIVVVNAESKKEHGYVIDKGENELMFELKTE